MLSHTFKQRCICLLLHNSLWLLEPLILRGSHYRLWLHQCVFEKQTLRLHNCGGCWLTLTHISWSWGFLLQFEGLILLFGSFDKEVETPELCHITASKFPEKSHLRRIFNWSSCLPVYTGTVISEAKLRSEIHVFHVHTVTILDWQMLEHPLCFPTGGCSGANSPVLTASKTEVTLLQTSTGNWAGKGERQCFC